jgi:hypothetical protein
MNRALSLLVPMLFAAAVVAQEPTESIARGFDAQAAFGLVHADDGTPLAIGHDYKASFRHGAMQFVPALGTAAPTNRPLSFRLGTIARGRIVLHDADAAAAPEPVVRDGVMTWSRSGILERYEARADGVAQSFVLAAHPGGNGDLVVRGTVESAFVPIQQEDGSLCFADEIGGVTIGGVTGIDANGRQCRGELRWQSGELELRLPGAFVDAAAYPLVLDPLFGTTVVYGGSSFDDGEVDVAYEAGSDTYLVVWARVFSTADHDVRAQRLDGNGAPIAGAISVTSASGLERRPSVGSVRVRQKYFVAWEEGPSFLGPFDIRGRTIDPGGAASGAVVDIGVGIDNDTSCAVSGVRSPTSGDDVLVAWSSNPSGITTRLLAIAANGSVTPSAPNVVSTPGGGFGGEPDALRLSRGRTPGSVSLLVIGRSSSISSVVVLDYSGNALATGGVFGSGPIGVDGAGGTFVVAWNLVGCACQSFVWSGSALTQGPVVQVPGSTSCRRPDVAFVGDRFLVTWEEQTATPFDNEIRGLAVLPDCSVCGQGFTVPTVARPNQRAPRLASRFSGGDSLSTDGLLVWEETASTLPFQGSIVGQRFGAMLGTPPVTLSAGCGNGGTAGTNGPFSPGNAGFRMTLAGGSLLAPVALLLLGVGDPPLVCGCPLTVSVATEAVLPNLGSASFAFPVPCDAAFLGFQMEFQWLLFGAGTTPCPLLQDVAASSRVRLTLAE